ncbi:arsenate-mycothiol transferase ArsC [Mariniluteicoccus flavus]
MMKTPTAASYAHVVEDLAERYADTFDRDEVAAAVEEARAAIEPTAKHPDFLEVLVAKHARDHLLARARHDGRVAKVVPEVLFVCVHNTGRSQMAAAIAEHLAGEHVHVRSAGLQPGSGLNPVVVEALAEVGINLDHAYPSGRAGDVVHAADVVVDMGADLPEMVGRRVVEWDVADPDHQPLAVVRKIRDDLQARVAGLLEELGVRGVGSA